MQIKKKKQENRKSQRLISTLLRYYKNSRDSSVGIPTGYRMESRGLIPDRGEIFLFSPLILCSDRLWGPPSLLYNGYPVGFFPESKSAGK
jgi:hypothetical protein